MPSKLLIPAFAALLSLLAFLASAQNKGRDVYIAKCSTCHAPNGDGNSTVGRTLKLGDMRPAISSLTDEQLRQLMLEGRGKMPPTKKLDPEQLRILVLFLRDLAAGNPDSGKAAAESQAEPLPRVQEIFHNKCSACHGPDGAGHTTIGQSLGIPDLSSTIVQDQSDDALAAIITKGKKKMPGYAKTFNALQVRQLVSHIRALAKTAGQPKLHTETQQPAVPLQAQPAPSGTVAAPPITAATAARDKSPEGNEKKITKAAATSAPAPPKQSKTAHDLYSAKCVACHSKDGSGTGTIGKSMHVPSLMSGTAPQQTDEQLAAVIRNGAGKMPPYNNKLTPEEIHLLVLYIRELQRRH